MRLIAAGIPAHQSGNRPVQFRQSGGSPAVRVGEGGSRKNPNTVHPAPTHVGEGGAGFLEDLQGLVDDRVLFDGRCGEVVEEMATPCFAGAGHGIESGPVLVCAYPSEGGGGGDVNAGIQEHNMPKGQAQIDGGEGAHLGR